MAYRIPHSSIVQNDAGEIGVRTVSDNNIVDFVKIALLGEGDTGAWVEGLTGTQNLITTGQGFVKAGQTVNQESRDKVNTP